MRGFALLATGLLTGFGLGSQEGQERDIVSLNHVAISVDNFDEASEFYSQTLGFPRAFTFSDEDGNPFFSYFQINRSTFIELMPSSPERPAGLVHFGLEVSDLDSLVARLQASGMQARGPVVSPRTGSYIAGARDPEGTFFELLEFGPESLHRKVMDAWR